MVICIVALVIFGVLGVFSTRYRSLAKQAFKCVTRMVTLRPCDVELEVLIKSKMVSKLMKYPRLAGFLYKNFKVISWIFTISFFVSLGYSAYGIYNIAVYGSCDPANPTCAVNSFWYFISCYENAIVSIVIFILIAFSIFYLKKRDRNED